jgi:hypothetical protein
MEINYSKWLMSMSDRAWRNSIDSTGSGVRELYPTDGISSPTVGINELFKLPSMVRVFQVTVPQSTFGAGSGAFVLGLIKFRTAYMFSQRRVNIGDLVNERTLGIREEERARAFKLISAMDENDVKPLNSARSGTPSGKMD